MAFDDQKQSEERQSELKNYATLQLAIVAMLKQPMSHQARMLGIKALEQVRFFDSLSSGEQLKEEWSKPVD